jgi:hypothetical protein
MYIGGWKKGMMDGVGKERHELDGSEWNGLWECGKYVGHDAQMKLDTAGGTATWLFGATIDSNRTHSNKSKRTLVSSNPADTAVHTAASRLFWCS